MAHGPMVFGSLRFRVNACHGNLFVPTFSTVRVLSCPSLLCLDLDLEEPVQGS